MLASTVQFSTYGQSPRIPHRQPDHPPGTPHRAHPPDDQRYDEHEAPQKKHPTRTAATATRTGPFPQDPTACLPPAPTTTAFHTHRFPRHDEPY